MPRFVLIYYAPRNATLDSSKEFVRRYYAGSFQITHIKHKFSEKTVYVQILKSGESDTVARALNGKRFGGTTVVAQSMEDTDPEFEPMI
eukprot:IDg22793t1